MVKSIFNQQNTTLNPVKNAGFFQFQRQAIAQFARVLVNNFHRNLSQSKYPLVCTDFSYLNPFYLDFLTM